MKFKLAEKETKQENVYEDPQAIGTEQYHRMNAFIKNFVATDGVAEMCKKLQCFWVMDIIVASLRKIKGKDEFFVVKVTRNGKGGADFSIEDDNGKTYAAQHIGYTDLKYDLKFYLSDDGELWVALLPSEY